MQLDPNLMKKLMKQINAKDIEATRVIIETSDNTIVISEPQVVKTEMGNVTSFQVSGKIKETPKYREEDLEIIQKKTGCTKEEAMEAWENSSGNIAEAILKIGEQ